MPPVATIERKRELYYIAINKYLQLLKDMPKEKIEEVAKKNLVLAGIIDENGDLTDHYENSR